MMIFSRPSYLPLIHCPGAVPLALGSTVAPVITSACLRLFGAIFQPRAAKRCSRLRDLGIAVQFKSQRIGHCFPRQVVFGRAESAHEDDDLGRETTRRPRLSVFAVIADDGFENYFNAELVQLLSQIKGVRVLPEGCQQLRADGDDLSIHE